MLSGCGASGGERGARVQGEATDSWSRFNIDGVAAACTCIASIRGQGQAMQGVREGSGSAGVQEEDGGEW
jgi:hypothetical protein